MIIFQEFLDPSRVAKGKRIAMKVKTKILLLDILSDDPISLPKIKQKHVVYIARYIFNC
jgi:hypothetical protein